MVAQEERAAALETRERLLRTAFQLFTSRAITRRASRRFCGKPASTPAACITSSRAKTISCCWCSSSRSTIWSSRSWAPRKPPPSIRSSVSSRCSSISRASRRGRVPHRLPDRQSRTRGQRRQPASAGAHSSQLRDLGKPRRELAAQRRRRVASRHRSAPAGALRVDRHGRRAHAGACGRSPWTLRRFRGRVARALRCPAGTGRH